MKIFDPSKRAINPVLLAMQTGITKGGNRLHATPFNGLNGMGLPVSLHGMGDAWGTAAAADPEPYSKAVLSVIATITDFFGIGAGRREADQITPIQNQIFQTVVQPIIDTLNTRGPSLSYQTLSQMWNDLAAAKAKWLQFLHNTDWSDGRAATQAEATLAPYFNDAQTKIQKFLQGAPSSILDTIGGVLPGGVYPGSSANISTIAMIGLGLLALMLLSGKRG